MKTPSLEWHQALGHQITDKRIDILRHVGELGSISEAARAVGVSYKAAWQAIDTLSNLAGVPLLDKVVGGRGGGGARLNDAGLQLLAAAERLQSARSAVTHLDGLALRTSMRNTLRCTVRALKSVSGAIEVQLELPDGQKLSSRITRESAQLLGLSKGLPVLALCKATAVQVTVKTDEPSGVTNHLQGQVVRLPVGGRAGEITLLLGADQHLVGFASAGHKLRKGDIAQARVEMSAVVVGLG